MQQLVVTFGRHVLEDVTQVESIERGGPGTTGELLERDVAAFEPVEIGANRVEVFRAEGARQCVAVGAGENPAHVWVRGRIEFGQGVPGTFEDGRRYGCLDIAEDLWRTAKPRHHGSRKEEPGHQAPSPRVPTRVIELVARVRGLEPQEIEYRSAPMHERQHRAPKEGEVLLESSHSTDAGVDRSRSAIPERAGAGSQGRPAARI